MKTNNKHIKNGFKIPTDYFDSIENSVFEKLSKNNLLDNAEYTVPKDYFKSVEDNVFKKLSLKEVKVISIKRIVTKITIAASILFIVSIIYLNNKSININQIAYNDIEVWLDENLETIDIYTIDEIFEGLEIDEFQNFNNTELTNQLIGHDIETILNEIETNY